MNIDDPFEPMIAKIGRGSFYQIDFADGWESNPTHRFPAEDRLRGRETVKRDAESIHCSVGFRSGLLASSGKTQT